MIYYYVNMILHGVVISIKESDTIYLLITCMFSFMVICLTPFKYVWQISELVKFLFWPNELLCRSSVATASL